jgi:ABC-type long-subunit fatty acid transport system fused permease/ATPase subunit
MTLGLINQIRNIFDKVRESFHISLVHGKRLLNYYRFINV